MKRYSTIGGLFLLSIIGYLLAWPVPIEPTSWQAPVDKGLVDPFAPNDLLQVAVGIDLGAFEGPEDATVGIDGNIYATTSGGFVVRIKNGQVSEFAFADGRPLGIETNRDGSFLVANAYIGLQRINKDGAVSTLISEFDGEPFVNVNNLAVGPDGTVYFSESSSKFGAFASSGTYEASLLDLMEHGGHGRIFSYNPMSGEISLLLDKLNYANGVAVSKDGRFLLVSETGNYRILKYWLAGEQQGRFEILLDNLPGFPDNLKSGRDGRFWLGLVAPRNQLLDRLSDNPFIRKIVQRLPALMRPKAIPSSHVVAFDEAGVVLANLQDTTARYPMLTGVVETNRALYLTTLIGKELPRVDKGDL